MVLVQYNMKIPQNDRPILRQLAEKLAEIAALPIHKEKMEMWRRLNDLGQVRPMVWINEIPWHEMNVNDELSLRTENEFCRHVETEMRRMIYQWRHLPGDMIVEPKFYSPLVIRDSGFGIREETDIVKFDEHNNIISQDFHPQIQTERDVERIKNPIVTFDEETTEQNYQLFCRSKNGALSDFGLRPGINW